MPTVNLGHSHWSASKYSFKVSFWLQSPLPWKRHKVLPLWPSFTFVTLIFQLETWPRVYSILRNFVNSRETPHLAFVVLPFWPWSMVMFHCTNMTNLASYCHSELFISKGDTEFDLHLYVTLTLKHRHMFLCSILTNSTTYRHSICMTLKDGHNVFFKCVQLSEENV